MDFDTIKKDIRLLADANQLDMVILFGSQATGKTHPQSDIDIAVLSRESVNRARIALQLDEIFKRNDIEVVNLALASPTLMHAVVREGKLLYERTPEMFFRWKIYAIKVWMETAWLRRLADKKHREWVKTLT